MYEYYVDHVINFVAILQVMHPFEAEDAGELGLSVGDYVVVRQVRLKLLPECPEAATMHRSFLGFLTVVNGRL